MGLEASHEELLRPTNRHVEGFTEIPNHVFPLQRRDPDYLSSFFRHQILHFPTGTTYMMGLEHGPSFRHQDLKTNPKGPDLNNRV